MVANKLDLQKKQHRERSQPVKRAKLGLLEKHADYVKRARDFHSKEDRIKKLREKAEGRNKDEFYFGMINSRTKKGVHIQSRGNEALPVDLVKVLKSQDAGYIRTQRSIEESKVTRLNERLNSLVEIPTASTSAAIDDDDDDWDMDDVPSTSAPIRSHVIFSDNLQKVRTATSASELLPKRPRTPAPVKIRKLRKGKARAIESDPATLAAEALAAVDIAKKHRVTLTTELTARRTRLTALTRAMRELEMQRMLMGKGAKKSLIAKKGAAKSSGGDEDGDEASDVPEAEEGIASGARVWKWKSERKR